MVWPNLDNKNDMIGLYLLAKKRPAVLNGSLLQSLVYPSGPVTNEVPPMFTGNQHNTIDDFV
jgi:hypothetical protein